MQLAREVDLQVIQNVKTRSDRGCYLYLGRAQLASSEKQGGVVVESCNLPSHHSSDGVYWR